MTVNEHGYDNDTTTVSNAEVAVGVEELINALEARLQEKGNLVFDSPHEILGVVTEEYHELVEAVRQGAAKRIDDELLDVAVAAVFGHISVKKGWLNW